MSEHLKVVGEIKPPDYKDAVKMLRNIADEIERGNYGEIETIVVALTGDESCGMFGGGRESGMSACGFLFSAAANRLQTILGETLTR